MHPSMNLTIKEVKALHLKKLCYIKKISAPYTLLIHPIYLGDIKKGVKVELDALKRKYYHSFKGIILGYDNVKVQQHGRFIDTNPFMHTNVHADFYIFAPEIGDVLQGKVVKKSPTHVGCLVHNLFNASSSVPNGVSKADWCGSLAAEGDTIELKITFLDLSSPVPYLRGDIVPESVGGEIDSKANLVNNLIVFKDEDEDED